MKTFKKILILQLGISGVFSAWSADNAAAQTARIGHGNTTEEYPYPVTPRSLYIWLDGQRSAALLTAVDYGDWKKHADYVDKCFQTVSIPVYWRTRPWLTPPAQNFSAGNPHTAVPVPVDGNYGNSISVYALSGAPVAGAASSQLRQSGTRSFILTEVISQTAPTAVDPNGFMSYQPRIRNLRAMWGNDPLNPGAIGFYPAYPDFPGDDDTPVGPNPATNSPQWPISNGIVHELTHGILQQWDADGHCARNLTRCNLHAGISDYMNGNWARNPRPGSGDLVAAQLNLVGWRNTANNTDHFFYTAWHSLAEVNQIRQGMGADALAAIP